MKQFKVTDENGETCLVTISPAARSQALEQVLVEDLLELRMSGIEVTHSSLAWDKPLYTRKDLIGLLHYLNNHTDIFNVETIHMMIDDAMENKLPADEFAKLLKLEPKQIVELVNEYVEDLGARV